MGGKGRKKQLDEEERAAVADCISCQGEATHREATRAERRGDSSQALSV